MSSVKRLDTYDRHFVYQVDGFRVVDKRHKRGAIVEQVLNPRCCIHKDLAAQNRAIGQRKFGIFANFGDFLMSIQGCTHRRNFKVRSVNEG